MRSRRILPFVLGLSMVALAACGSGDDGGGSAEPASNGDGPVIGVSLVTTTRGFHSEVFDGMKEAAAERGITLISADSNGDVIRQLDDVDGLVQRGIDGLLIVPVDATGSVPAYEAADAAGVPVMSVARDADTDLKVSYIGAEWESYGSDIAQWMCDNVPAPGTVAMIKGPAGASHVLEMSAGFNETLSSSCPDLEIVFEANAQSDGAEPGVALAQDALSAYPDVDAMYVNADDTAMGVIQALVEQGKIDDVVVTGFNGEPSAFDAIRDGTLDMTFALKPFAWGKLAFNTMMDHLEGKSIPSMVGIETLMVDQNNIGTLSEDELR